MFRSSALFSAIIVVPGALTAQQLRGVIRDAGTSNPLAGAVVSAIDSAGTQTTRAIADAQGRFTIVLPARTARLHLIRIGYRPRDVNIPTRFDTPLDVTMDRIPPLLETMRVSGRELCPGSAERGAAFALWEQARAGLLAAVVARELKPANARLIAYERGVSPNDELVRHQKTEIRAGSTTRPFLAAAEASYFAQAGFMSDAGDGSRIYNAPDADVLLDPAFAATHCFHLQAADAEHRGQIGLAFNPVRGRDELVDVTGVIWIDQATPQLRSFDFSYTSLEPPAAKMNAGGHLEFRTMPNGVSFIERWNLRLPVMTVVASTIYRPATASPVRRQDRTDLQLTEITEAGGVVLDATWADSVAWHAPPTVIAGTVVQRKTNQPVKYAIVSLAGTSDSTMSDSTGAFRLEVLPGKYSLIASDTLLREFVAERTDHRDVIAERDRTTTVRVEVDQVANVLAGACNGERMPDNVSIITGHVTPIVGDLPRGARMQAMWQADYDPRFSGGIKVDVKRQDSPVDDHGRFLICGVARERPVHLQLRIADAGFADTTIRIYNERLTYAVDWRVPPLVADGGTLFGIIIGAGEKPIAGADVSIVQLRRHVVADELGRFQFDAVKPGRYTLLTRHDGFAQLSDTVTVAPRSRVARVLTLKPSP